VVEPRRRQRRDSNLSEDTSERAHEEEVSSKTTGVEDIEISSDDFITSPAKRPVSAIVIWV
jgi:hypothetical protein